MKRLRVGVVGASGYSGAVAGRLLARHPNFELAFCTSDKLAGQLVEDHLAVPVAGDLRFEKNGSALELGATVDAVILATSADVSAKLAPEMLALGRRVVDLSGAFRLETSADYTRWYGFEHPAPALLESAHYGLPELFAAPNDAKLVSNPGCYPTAALLALGPLVRAGLVERTGIVIDAKSGVSGAGRQAKEEYSFVELDEDLRAYKLFAHQHTPGITRSLTRLAGAPVSLTFTAHLLPLRRGLLATCYARPRSGVTASAVSECLASAYADRRFVRAVAPDKVRLSAVAGTNLAYVGATTDGDTVIAIGAIDNLVKGAAGQAVQNLNIAYGLDETTGLCDLQRFGP